MDIKIWLSKKTWFFYTLLIILIIYIGLWLWTISLANSQQPEGQYREILPVATSDSVEYATLAENLINSRRFHADTNEFETFRTPGYPIFIAIVISIFHSYFAVTFIQIALTAATSWLLFLLCKKYLNKNVATIAAILYITSISVATHTLILMSDTLFIFLIMAGVYILFRPSETKLWQAALAGLILGAATLTRPISLYIPIIIFPMYILLARPRANMKQILLTLLVVLTFFGGVIGPWITRNYYLAGKASLSSVSAYNLFHYNLPIFMAANEGMTKEDARQYFYSQLSPEAQKNKFSLTSSNELKAVSHSYLKDHIVPYTVFHVIKSIPFLLASGLKTSISLYNNLFTNDQDIELANQNISNLILSGNISAAFSTITKNPLIFLEMVFRLAIILLSIYTIIRQPQNGFVWFCCALIAYFALLTGPVSYDRYRIPAEPFLLTMAAFGLTTLYQDIKNQLTQRPIKP